MTRHADGFRTGSLGVRLLAALGVVVGLTLAGCATSERPKSSHDASLFNARLGMEYLRQGDVQGARDKIERALQQDAQNPAAHVAAAFLYERMGDEARTIKHYDTAVRLKRDDPETMNSYGVYLCRHNRAADGAKFLIQAARSPLYRTPEVAFNNAGVCLHTAGRLEEAEAQFKEALKLQPRNLEALAQLVSLNVERLRYALARSYLLRFLEAGTATAEVLGFGMRIERGLGNDAAAEQYAKRLKKEFPASEQARAIGTSPTGG